MRAPVQARLHWLAANVRNLRTARHWTQEELAERADIDVRYVRTLESPNGNPRVAILIKLSLALNVALGPLFERATLAPPRRGRPPKPKGRKVR